MKKRALSFIEVSLILTILGLVAGGVWLAILEIQQTKKVTQFQKEMGGALANMQHQFGTRSWAEINLTSMLAADIFPSSSLHDGTITTPWGSSLQSVKTGITFATLTFAWGGHVHECLGIDRAMRAIGLTGMVNGIDSNNLSFEGQIGIQVPQHEAAHNCKAAVRYTASRTIEIDLSR